MWIIYRVDYVNVTHKGGYFANLALSFIYSSPVLGIYEVFMFTAVETIVSTGAYHRVFRMMGALEEALEVNVVEYSYLELSAQARVWTRCPYAITAGGSICQRFTSINSDMPPMLTSLIPHCLYRSTRTILYMHVVAKDSRT